MTQNTESPNSCLVCCENIRTGARKCIHCESFQDWRRYLNFSNTLLALLVALVSVSTILIPILAELFQKNISNVSMTYHGVHQNLLNFVASNDEAKDGIVAEEVLHLFDSDSGRISFDLEPRFDQIIIYGGQTRQLTTRLAPLDFPKFLAWLQNSTLTRSVVEVRAENYGANDWKAEFEVTKSDIKSLEEFAVDYQKRYAIP